MRVLLTGGSGFIGRAAGAALRDAGHEVVTDPGARPDAALLLGWPGGPGRMRDPDANAAAARATVALARELHASGCARIVASGSCVEALPSHAVGRLPYAVAKREVHDALAALPGATCAHVFGVTGPGEDPRRGVPQVVRALLAGREIAVSSGTQRRDVLHVADVARGLVTVLEHDTPQTLDVCRGEAPPLRDLFVAIERETGTTGLLRWGAAELPESDRYDAVGDATGLRGLGAGPPRSVAETAADTVAWWRTQDDPDRAAGSAPPR